MNQPANGTHIFNQTARRLLMVGLDTETTGIDPSRAKIVQIATVAHCPGVIPPEGKCRQELVDPLIPIPPGATAVHHLTDEMVKDKPSFAEIAKDLTQLVAQLNQGGAACVGYNVRKYDWPLLQAEFARIGFVVQTPIFIDVCDLACWHFRHLISRKLSAVAAHLGVPFAEGEAHEALADVRKSFEVLAKIRELCQLPDDLEGDMQLALRAQIAAVRIDAEYDAFGPIVYRCRYAWLREDAPFRIGIGKHCGTLLSDLSQSYLSWLAENVLPSAKSAVWDAFRVTKFASGFDLDKFAGPWRKPKVVRP